MRFNEHSQEQKDIILTKDKRILVNAVAGSGKTTTLESYVDNYILNGGKWENILACTFTRKMAGELKRRFPLMEWCDTIHGIAHRIVQIHFKLIEYDSVILIDENEDKEIIKTIIDRNRLKKLSVTKAQELITEFCKTGIYGSTKEDKDLFMKIYLRELRNNNMVTYNLLEYFSYLIVSTHDIKFDLVMVDEFQDTTIMERKIVENMSNNLLVVVGDYMQCIYEWRGSHPENMKRIKVDKEYNMSTSYRLPDQIVNLANQVISMNRFGYEMEMRPTGKEGRLELTRGITPENIRNSVVDALKYLRPEEIFILTRTNRQAFELIGILHGLPIDEDYIMIKDTDYFSWLNIAAFVYLNGYYNYGMIRLMRLLSFLDKEIMPYEFEEGKIYDKVKNDIRVKNFNDIMERDIPFCEKAPGILMLMERSPREFDRFMEKVIPFMGDIQTPQDYLQWFQDMSANSFLPTDKIAILTVHAAKGMENEGIIIPFVEDGVFPSHRAKFEEELRLFYVAITRAKSYLHIIHNQSRFLGSMN